jgi:hypothetical protein
MALFSQLHRPFFRHFAERAVIYHFFFRVEKRQKSFYSDLTYLMVTVKGHGRSGSGEGYGNET